MSDTPNANMKRKAESIETAVRRTLFIRALEENGDDEPLSRAADRFLEDEAARSGADFEKLVLERARLTQEDLERRWNIVLTPLFDFNRRNSLIVTALIAALAFVLGLLSNVLDRGPVNILFNAFMFLLLWHLLVYLLMIVRSVFSRRLGKMLSDIRPGPVESALSWILERLESLLYRFTAARKAKIWNKILTAQPRFRIYLARQFNRVLRLRIMVRLNTMAIFSTLGVIAGMYFAGLVHDYRFIWYSTFIDDPGVVASFLRIIFAPVLLVFQRDLPALATQGVELPGADWIHLFAQAALLYVVVPRAIVVLLAHMRSGKHSRNCSLDLSESYFTDLLRPYRGGDLKIVPVTFSYSPDDDRTLQLQSLLRNRFGDRAEMCEPVQLAWGDSLGHGSFDGTNTVISLLFNGIQTPEHEVHGTLVREAVDWLNSADGIAKLTVLIDTSELEPGRRDERLKLWESVLLRAGVEKVNAVSLKDDNGQRVQLHVMGEEN